MTYAQPGGRPLTGLAADIHGHLTGVIERAQASDPRSLQRAIGPSEIGTPCLLRLAQRLCGMPEVNNTDRWPSTVGTAVHSWLADTFEAENKRLGWARYLVEQRVQVQGNIHGNSDLFDQHPQVRCVYDWKIVGASSYAKYRAQGPGEQYRIQGHLYGLGQENAGREVKHVAVIFVPRNGPLKDTYVWTEPYDRSVALAALDRLDGVLAALTVFDPQADPSAWARFPRVDSGCHFCPRHLPRSSDLSVGCPGPGPIPVLAPR